MTIRPTPLRPLRAPGFRGFQSTYPDFSRRITHLRKIRDREFAKLTTMTARERHSRTRKLLRSYDLHLLYAYEAIRKLKRLTDCAPADIEALAAQCSPLHHSTEAAAIHWIASRNRRRPVTSFGPIKRMQQMLVGDLLRSLHPPLGNQFLFRGGMPMAFLAVEAAIREGFIYGTEVDIVDFYGSVRLERLAEMLRPLPEAAVRHVVWDRRDITDCVDDATTSMSWAYPSPNGYAGLALGSACSPIVGEKIIASLLAHGHGDQCRMISYADNILVLARTPELVDACYSQMQEQAATFAGWSLGPRRGVTKNLAQQGFDFLHHSVWQEGENFVWAPDQRKIEQFLLAEAERELTLSDIQSAEDKITHWRRAYPGWPMGDLWETRQLAGLTARRFYISASPINKVNAANSLIASYFAGGRLEALEEIAPSGNSPQDEKRRLELIDAAHQRLVMFGVAGQVGHDAIRFLG